MQEMLIAGVDVPLIYPHKLCHESFQMEDDLATHANAVLVKCCPLHDFRFEGVVEPGHELEGEGLNSAIQVSELGTWCVLFFIPSVLSLLEYNE